MTKCYISSCVRSQWRLNTTTTATTSRARRAHVKRRCTANEGGEHGQRPEKEEERDHESSQERKEEHENDDDVGTYRRNLSAREYIDLASPKRNVFGEYREQPIDASSVDGDGYFETPLLLSDEIPLLPGSVMAMGVERDAWEGMNHLERRTEGEDRQPLVVVCVRDAMQQERGSLSTLARVEDVVLVEGMGSVLVTVRGEERVLVQEFMDVGGTTSSNMFARSAKLGDRWLYFKILQEVETHDKEYLNLQLALTEIMQRLEDLLVEEETERTERVRRVLDHILPGYSQRGKELLGQVIASQDSGLVLALSERASFAALQDWGRPKDSDKLKELQKRAMTTTDLGERLELAANFLL